MQSITESTVESLITPEDARAAVRKAHIALAEGKAENVVRTRAKSGKMMLHAMSATDSASDLAAAKIYTSNPRMVSCHVMLYRISTGELLAMIEGEALGRLRTAAAAILGTECLAPPEVGSLGIFGSGYQAEGFLQALAHSKTPFKPKRVMAFSRNTDRLKQFAAKLNCEATESAEALCAQADVIVAATTTASPLFEASHLKHCVHITSLGSNALNRQEIAVDVVSSSALICVDTKPVAKMEGGNLQPALETGLVTWNEIAELGQIILSPPKISRSKSKPWTLFCSHGVALQDLYLAKLVYEHAKA